MGPPVAELELRLLHKDSTFFLSALVLVEKKMPPLRFSNHKPVLMSMEFEPLLLAISRYP